MNATPTLQGCFGTLARAEKLINDRRRQNLKFFKEGLPARREIGSVRPFDSCATFIDGPNMIVGFRSGSDVQFTPCAEARR